MVDPIDHAYGGFISVLRQLRYEYTLYHQADRSLIQGRYDKSYSFQSLPPFLETRSRVIIARNEMISMAIFKAL
jgi:hypothetical protein